MKKTNKYTIIEIPLIIYPVHMIVMMNTDYSEIKQHLISNKVSISPQFEKAIRGWLDAPNTKGYCCAYGYKENPDVLILLKSRPKKASEYGILYHEIYHATDRLSRSLGLIGFETKAYLFQYLITECNRVLWKQ